MTFRQFVATTIEQVEAIARDFDRPDDDFEPVALLCGRDAVDVVLLGPAMTGDTAIGVVWQALAETARASGTRMLATVTSEWVIDSRRPGAEETAHALRMLDEAGKPLPPFRGLPGCIEAVGASFFDAERREDWRAEILRDEGRAPTLGPWETFVDGQDGTVRDFAFLLQEALR